ncbi:Maf family protein [Robbsia sp. Bb-Pol-6]|uniref:dTTP/UTP pyrophosphatase n=1 Tax=Robbsia betulipollinis TaxID=2981849 RepID=A0ABT3ZML9_9BURK|nr:Maf family protein [Robbsia betulipollinis]MCY0387717.1 Maf family protein [Robbsia betulipollinis]
MPDTAAPFPFVYLASQSPRRRELLDQIGVRFEMLLPEAHEDAEALEALIAGEPAPGYVQRVCLAKADAALARRVRRALPAAPILSADTTVACEGAILGKPRDADDAAAMLRRLSGRTHQVWTAVAVVAGDAHPAPAGSVGGTPARHALALSRSDVRFAALDDTAIARYIAGGEPFGKAGGYGIQGTAAAFVENLSGSYSGVMGLPLFETARLLRQAGVRF